MMVWPNLQVGTLLGVNKILFIDGYKNFRPQQLHDQIELHTQREPTIAKIFLAGTPHGWPTRQIQLHLFIWELNYNARHIAQRDRSTINKIQLLHCILVLNETNSHWL